MLECSDDFSYVGQGIREGGIVVYPTDTVYGLGSSPLSEFGVKRCFQIKLRPLEKRVPILFSSIQEAAKLVIFNKVASTLASHFWPGKLTLILPLKDPSSLPSALFGNASNEKNLAVRVPGNECALALIKACHGCLIGTSANISGKPATIKNDDPDLLELANRCDFFIRGKCGADGKPSTVIDLTTERSKFVIEREGAIPSEVIERLL